MSEPYAEPLLLTSGPVIGCLTAEMMRTGRTLPEAVPFSLTRFA